MNTKRNANEELEILQDFIDGIMDPDELYQYIMLNGLHVSVQWRAFAELCVQKFKSNPKDFENINFDDAEIIAKTLDEERDFYNGFAKGTVNPEDLKTYILKIGLDPEVIVELIADLEDLLYPVKIREEDDE